MKPIGQVSDQCL